MPQQFSNEAPQLDLTIAQGATFVLGPMTWKDAAGAAINLTGYSARMKIRNTIDGDVLLDASSLVALGGVAGTITVTIADDTTAGFTWIAGTYDLEVESAGGVTTRLLRGEVTISRENTRT